MLMMQHHAPASRSVLDLDEVLAGFIHRQLEIIGEATFRLSDHAKCMASHVPWRQLSGMRNRLILAYTNADQEVVWDVLQNELSSLEQATRQLLSITT
jgi:uncharacterized protein with HEPN domain